MKNDFTNGISIVFIEIITSKCKEKSGLEKGDEENYDGEDNFRARRKEEDKRLRE